MPPTIDWYYHRNGCRTCARAQELIEKVGAKVAEQTDARKVRLGPAEAVRLARAAGQLWVARGKKVVHLDMKKDQPSDAELKRLMIGPSGNLRAPTIRRGKGLFIGFEPTQLSELLR